MGALIRHLELVSYGRGARERNLLEVPRGFRVGTTKVFHYVQAVGYSFGMFIEESTRENCPRRLTDAVYIESTQLGI